MPAIETEETVQTINILKETDIAAPVDAAFQAILEEIGPGLTNPDGTPMKMKLEPWPGGRWFSDLGTNTGHLWGHVQVIKPPNLLELRGPMFMSYPATNFVQYRLTASGQGSRLTFTHRAMGLIPREHAEGVQQGWQQIVDRIKTAAERRARR